MGPFVTDPGLINPLGMAWGPDGNLYVANQGGNEVRRYDGVSGTRLPDFISAGAGGLSAPAFLVFIPPPSLSLQAVNDLAHTWAALVVSGGRPGAKLAFVRGTAGGSGTIADCPALTLPLGSPTVSAVRMADESGSGVVSVQGTSGSSQSFVAVDTFRCLATAVTTVTVP